MMHFERAGDIEKGHTHQFDHLTLLAKGSLKIVIDGSETDFNAPHMIYIRKNKNHKLIALEDDTVAYCIHAITPDENTINMVSPDMVPKL